MPDGQRRNLWSSLKRSGGDGGEARACGNGSGLVVDRRARGIAPLLDVLNLGREARMNVPGRAEGNWRWRCTEQMFTRPAFEWLELKTTSSR